MTRKEETEEINGDGYKFVYFYAFNDLCTEGSPLQQKKIHMAIKLKSSTGVKGRCWITGKARREGDIGKPLCGRRVV